MDDADADVIGGARGPERQREGEADDEQPNAQGHSPGTRAGIVMA
jgi:hypothetical protein